jgi:hypothetical protein
MAQGGQSVVACAFKNAFLGKIVWSLLRKRPGEIANARPIV